MCIRDSLGTHPKISGLRVFDPRGRLGVTMTAANLSAEELAMLADTDVLGHIRRENAQRQKIMDKTPGVFYMMVAESVADRCANVYEYEPDMACDT